MTILVRNVTDLPEGTQLPTGDDEFGVLTVVSTYFEPAGEGLPAFMEVDVTCDRAARIGDLNDLAKLVGADEGWWLSSVSLLKVRLLYPATATVETIDA